MAKKTKKTKTNDIDNTDLEFRKYVLRYRIFEKTTPWFWGCILAFIFYLTVDSLAGKTTLVDFALKTILDLSLDRYASYLLTLFATSWAIKESILRKKTIKELAPAKENSEKLIDPNRVSSDLTETGDTRPEDKL